MSKRYTHRGTVEQCLIRPAAVPVGKYRNISLRETSKYWYGDDGKRYKKGDGFEGGVQDYCVWHLDLESITKLDKSDTCEPRPKP